MPKLDGQPFKESCCDGGATWTNENSCQPCGCDRGANHVCERHQRAIDSITTTVCSGPFSPASECPVHNPSKTVNAAKRKEYPIATGVLDYFPDALMEVAHVSFVGNQQHHADKPLHWDRSKSTDEADAMMRHFKDRGTLDTDGLRHSAKVAWRCLALLQKEIELERK